MNIFSRFFKRHAADTTVTQSEMGEANCRDGLLQDGLEHIVITEEEQRRNLLSEPDLILREEIRKQAAALGNGAGRVGSAEEIACARAIRDGIGKSQGIRASMQAFKACRTSGVGAFIPWLTLDALTAAIYLLSYALRQAGAILSIAVTVTFALLLIPTVLCFFGRFTKLPSTVSYNVIGERAGDADGLRRTVAIATSHGARHTAFVSEAFLSNAICSALLLLCGIISICIRLCTAYDGWHAFIFLLPAVAEIAAILLSLLALRGDKANCIDIALAVRLYSELAESAADGVRLMFVSLGAEGASHAGAKALLKAHPELTNAEVLCLDGIGSGGIRVIAAKNGSEGLVSRVLDCADREELGVMRVSHEAYSDRHRGAAGYIERTFAEAGACTVAITSPKAVGCSDADGAYRVMRRMLKGLIAESRDGDSE